MKRGHLEQLGTLAALRAARSAARLAGPMAIVAEIRRRDAALRDDVADGAGLAARIAADRHRAWRRDQLARLSVVLARAEAEAQPLREVHARDTAREEVVKALIAKSKR